MVGLVLLLAAFVILANIIVDMLYAVIDPRVAARLRRRPCRTSRLAPTASSRSAT